MDPKTHLGSRGSSSSSQGLQNLLVLLGVKKGPHATLQQLLCQLVLLQCQARQPLLPASRILGSPQELMLQGSSSSRRGMACCQAARASKCLLLGAVGCW